MAVTIHLFASRCKKPLHVRTPRPEFGEVRDFLHNKVFVCWASQSAMRSLFRPSFGPPRRSTKRWSNVFHWCRIFKALGCSTCSFRGVLQLRQSSLQPHMILARGSVSPDSWASLVGQTRSMIGPVCHTIWVGVDCGAPPERGSLLLEPAGPTVSG